MLYVYFILIYFLSSFAFQNVMNKMHTISVPYSVMKTCPLSWVQRVHAHKGSYTQHLSFNYVTVGTKISGIFKSPSRDIVLCFGGLTNVRVQLLSLCVLSFSSLKTPFLKNRDELA